MLAYNHENYIAQAIQSIMDQKTDLPYELVIGEDFSTDNTRAVINEFKERYPEKIRVLENATNLGMHDNFLNTIFSCRGKYLCMCEGDDYWINPDKLNLQYQFLEANPDYVMACGNHKRYFQKTDTFDRGSSVSVKDHDITFAKLIRFNCITSATIMFRNVLKREDFTPDFYSIISCDWYMHMRLLGHGKIRYLSHHFAVYRINEGSINGRTNRLTISRKELDFLELVKKGNLVDLDGDRMEEVEKSILLKNYDLAQAHAMNGNRKTALKLCADAIKRIQSPESLRQFAKATLLIASPGLFNMVRNVKRAFRKAA